MYPDGRDAGRCVGQRFDAKKWQRISLAALGLCLTFTPPVSADVVDRPYLRTGPVVIVFGASDYLEAGGVAPVVGDFLLLDDASTGGSGQAGTDLITGDLRPINYNTQRFNPINSPEEAGFEYTITDPTFGGAFNSVGPHQTLDGNDSYDAFGLDETTDITRQGGGGRASRFYVASNAPFDIFARASNLTNTGGFSSLGYENIRFRFRVQTTGGGGTNRWGTAAQDPSIGGSGVVIGQTPGPLATLDDLSGANPVKIFDGGRRTAARRGNILEQAVSFQARYNLRQAGAAANANNFDFSLGTGTLAADVTYTIYSP
jgi:hypothetical protein